MAIYHCSMKSISRGAGQSIVAAAAYRNACKLEDERTGEVHDYRRKHGLESSSICLPSGVNPSWAQDRARLWNAAEAAEKRKDARLGREIVLALPEELNTKQRRELAGEMASHIAERYGLAVDVAIHQPSRQGDQRNHHAHMLMSSRRITSHGFGEKARELDDHKRGPKEVEYIRAKWTQLANNALELAGHRERIDHRSLVVQGVKRMPTLHLGAAATAMERRGERTRLGDRNREAQEINARIQELTEIVKQQQMNPMPEQVKALPAEEVSSKPQEAETAKETQARKSGLSEADKIKGEELKSCLEMVQKELATHQQRFYKAENRYAAAQAKYNENQKEIEKYNQEFDSHNFMTRIVFDLRNRKRADKLNRNLKVFWNEMEAAKEELNAAKSRVGLWEENVSKAQAEYKATPYFAEQKRIEEQERRKKEQEAERELKRQAEREELGKQYGEAIKKLILPEIPSLAIQRAEYGQYLDKMQAASPEQRAEMVKELNHAERRYEVQELFYAVAERYSQDTSISGRKRFRDAMLKEWDTATPEHRKQMELGAKDHISRMPEKQKSRGMDL